MAGKPRDKGVGSSPVFETMWYALILAPSLSDPETNPPICVLKSAAQKFSNKHGATKKDRAALSPNAMCKNSKRKTMIYQIRMKR